MKKTKSETTKNILTKKELEILILLYRFRFLNRVQTQVLLGHKHHNQVQLWLNSLVSKGCIAREYDRRFAGGSAVYSLALRGRKQIVDRPDVEAKLLNNRVWREKERTEEFRDHCHTVNNIYISLIEFAKKYSSKLHFYTKTDLYGMTFMIRPNPDAYFALEPTEGDTKRYFLEVFEDAPSAKLRKRVQRYLEYYDDEYWNEKYPDKPFPEVIFVCPNKRMKGHLYMYIKNKIDEYPDLYIYLTTKELVAKKGLVREVLEKVEPED